MTTRENRRARADRHSRQLRIDGGAELREIRVGAGLSLDDVGAAIGMSGSEVGRIERGLIEDVSVRNLDRIAHASGHHLSLKLYPADDLIPRCRTGAPARAAPRAAPSVTRLAYRGAAPWRHQPQRLGRCGQIKSDRTAIDAETRIRDSQALTRRLELKFERDRTVARLVVLVADTRNNRRALELIREGMREAFPLDTREILAAFARGELPAAGGIVVL